MIAEASPAPGGLRVRRRRLLEHGWPVALLFLGIPIWWTMGLSIVIGPLTALPALVYLTLKGRVRAPRGFALWLLFLGWMFVSATQLADTSRFLAWLYRGSWYVGSTILFLYLINISRESLPSRKVVNALAVFWAISVIGGIIGMILPNFSFTTPMEALLPQRALATRFVFDMVHASTTAQKAFARLPIYRTKVPFAYTNQWGSTFAIALPFAICALGTVRSWLVRKVLIGLLITSILPLVFSLDRGAWLSTAVGVGYATFMLTVRRNPGAAGALLVGGLVITAILLFTPLGAVILDRVNHGYGDTHRQRLYSESISLAKASPVFGYGAPVDFESGPKAISAGTHGQFWTILVSQGIPGVVFFFGWFALALYDSLKRAPGITPEGWHIRFWAHVTIVTAISQGPYYEWLPYGFPLVMVAAALAYRELPLRRRRPPLPSLSWRTAMNSVPVVVPELSRDGPGRHERSLSDIW